MNRKASKALRRQAVAIETEKRKKGEISYGNNYRYAELKKEYKRMKSASQFPKFKLSKRVARFKRLWEERGLGDQVIKPYPHVTATLPAAIRLKGRQGPVVLVGQDDLSKGMLHIAEKYGQKYQSDPQAALIAIENEGKK